MSENPGTRRSALAAGCVVALGITLSACGGSSKPVAQTPPSSPATVTGTAPSPPTIATTPSTPSTQSPAKPSSSLPTVATPETPAPVISGFLTADQLPDAGARRWSREYVTPVHIEEPLAETCGSPTGTELNTDVWDALYPSADGRDSAEEQVHTFASVSYAESRMAAFYPKCSGVTVHTATGFAWRGPGPRGTGHTLFARWNNKIATLVITVTRGDYDSSLDVRLLDAMTQRLADTH
jgi:hypothetical protein